LKPEFASVRFALPPRLDADLDPAERLGQVVEPGQVHLGEVVDLLPGDASTVAIVAVCPAWLAAR
jgi:hypothetical protein